MKSALYAATTTIAYSQALKWISLASREIWSKKLIELSLLLEKIPHRGYTEASLEKKAGLDSIFHGKRNGVNSCYQIAGIVLEVLNGKYFIMQTQNTFSQNNTLEVLTFDGNVIEVPTKKMMYLDNNPVEKSKPNRLLRFSWPKGARNYNSEKNFSRIEPMNVVRFKSMI
tara:strand:- start:81 stop:590 length:510 start_codon:yes stop_codon:yes gene_type:complete